MKRCYLFFLFIILLSAPTILAQSSCPQEQYNSCLNWAQEQLEELGCTPDQETFEHSIQDLYFHKGCRIKEIHWYDLTSNESVKAMTIERQRTDNFGCTLRYTPQSYYEQSGFFRTPQESLEGQLRNPQLSNCKYNGYFGRPDARTILEPIIAQVESCQCGGQSIPEELTSEDNSRILQIPPDQSTQEQQVAESSTLTIITLIVGIIILFFIFIILVIALVRKE